MTSHSEMCVKYKNERRLHDAIISLTSASKDLINYTGGQIDAREILRVLDGAIKQLRGVVNE